MKYILIDKDLWDLSIFSEWWAIEAEEAAAAVSRVLFRSDSNTRWERAAARIYTYEASWHIYAMNWSFRHKNYRLAITSLLEQYPNRVKIVQRDESSGDPISWLPQAISSAYGESMTMDQAQVFPQ